METRRDGKRPRRVCGRPCPSWLSSRNLPGSFLPTCRCAQTDFAEFVKIRAMPELAEQQEPPWQLAVDLQVCLARLENPSDGVAIINCTHTRGKAMPELAGQQEPTWQLPFGLQVCIHWSMSACTLL